MVTLSRPSSKQDYGAHTIRLSVHKTLDIVRTTQRRIHNSDAFDDVTADDLARIGLMPAQWTAGDESYPPAFVARVIDGAAGAREAVASEAVRYTLRGAPAKAAIDPLSGRLDCTPAEQGIFAFDVVATGVSTKIETTLRRSLATGASGSTGRRQRTCAPCTTARGS